MARLVNRIHSFADDVVFVHLSPSIFFNCVSDEVVIVADASFWAGRDANFDMLTSCLNSAVLRHAWLNVTLVIFF